MLQEFDFQHFIQNVFTYITGNPKVLSILISLVLLMVLYGIIKTVIRKLSSAVKYYFYISIWLSSVNILITILSYFTITLPFGISSILLNSGSLITLLIGLWTMKKELEQLGI